MGLNYQARPSGAIIRHVCIHTNEGPNVANAAGNLASFLTSTQNTSNPVSYHVLVDNGQVIRYLPDNQEAWAALGCNPIGLHLCLTGYAAQTRIEWLNDYPQLKLAAKVVSDWCNLHNIPKAKILPGDVADNKPGIIGHLDWTLGKRDGTHTDPGTNFPWDYFIALVKAADTTTILTPTKVADMSIQNFEVAPGNGFKLIGCPVGKASQISNQAWVGSQILGPPNGTNTVGTVWYWFQNDTGGVDDSKKYLPLSWSNGHSTRQVVPVPDGTTQIRVEYSFPNGGTVTLEVQSK